MTYKPARLDPFKLAYDRCQLYGRLKLTASVSNQLKSVWRLFW